MANPNFVQEHSTYEIWRADDTSRCLDDDLVSIESDLVNKANSNHTHTNYADVDHTHSNYAASDHTHTGYAEAEHTHSGYAASDHTHTGYAEAEHTHDEYAPSSHSHNEYAVVEHTHSGYANSSHNHIVADITGLQSTLDNKATITYVDNSIANLLNNSSAAVDSIMELKDVMEDNADAISALETIAANKANAVHSHDVATTTTAGFQSPSDKAKLDGIEANANNYTHPSTHSMSMIAGLESALSGKASSTHTHSNYAASDHTHTGYASSTHTHTGYASTSHTHTASDVGAAPSSHTHTLSSLGAFASAGGTISGDTNVAGVLKVQGQQAFYYQSSSASQTIGTNNATGGTTICCGASASVGVNGTNLKTPNIIPRTNNAYTLGNTTYRFKGIYSTAAVNVSSDERLKRNITSINNEKLAKFVDGLNVVSYNYKDDKEDEKARIGLIAQQVQSVDEELAKFFVSEDENGMLSMTTADLVFALIGAVKELKKEIEELKK